MTSQKEAWEKVQDKFSQKKAAREELIRTRKSELFARVPRLLEVEVAITSLAYEIFANVAGGKYSPEDAKTILEERLSQLNDEKHALLLAEGLDEDYLNPPYDCPLCRDSGTVDGKICSCFRKELGKEQFQISNLTDAMRHQTFSAMRMDLYSDTPNARLGCSVKEYMGDLRALSLNYVKNFSSKKESLLFYGASGLGKTYFSSAIANALLDEGYSVSYQSAVMLFPLLQQKAFGKNPEEYEELLKDLLSADLLILDDLGTEMITNFTVPEFFKILNGRLNAEKPMIISTNLDMKEISRIYSERISSRIQGAFTPCLFVGDDLRIKK